VTNQGELTETIIIIMMTKRTLTPIMATLIMTDNDYEDEDEDDGLRKRALVGHEGFCLLLDSQVLLDSMAIRRSP